MLLKPPLPAPSRGPDGPLFQGAEWAKEGQKRHRFDSPRSASLPRQIQPFDKLRTGFLPKTGERWAAIFRRDTAWAVMASYWALTTGNLSGSGAV